jgi:hypothetical protein
MKKVLVTVLVIGSLFLASCSDIEKGYECKTMWGSLDEIENNK